MIFDICGVSIICGEIYIIFCVIYVMCAMFLLDLCGVSGMWHCLICITFLFIYFCGASGMWCLVDVVQVVCVKVTHDICFMWTKWCMILCVNFSFDVSDRTFGLCGLCDVRYLIYVV